MPPGHAAAAPRSRQLPEREDCSSRAGLMDYGYFHYEEPYARPRRRVNYFAWKIAILLLIVANLAAWLLSFYVFGQPERPDSYHLLQKLHKVEEPKRFELTAAPSGEFLNPK